MLNINRNNIVHRAVVNNLRDYEALIICDFSENYDTKMSEEIQSLHFGASKGQVTLHTGVIYSQNKCQSFCSVSPNISHKPAAIWAHLAPVLNVIKEETPTVSVIHFYSDGPTSQYRQKHNFYLHSHFIKSLNFKHSTWSFFEAGHGKGVADGIGGTVKRVLDKQVCFGRDVSDAKEAFEILKNTMKVIKIFYIEDEAIDKISFMLPNTILPLKGTFEVHQIIVEARQDLFGKHRKISCFCGDTRGLCQCFFVRTHHLLHVSRNNHSENQGPLIAEIEDTVAAELFNYDIAHIDMTITTDTIDDILVDNAEENLDILLNKAVTFEHEDEDKENDLSELPFQENQIANTIKSSYIPSSSMAGTTKNFLSLEYDPLLSLNSIKPQKEAKHTKSLKTIVSRKISCDKCKAQSVLTRITKCMVCKKWFCWNCSGGQIYMDYICDACLLGD